MYHGYHGLLPFVGIVYSTYGYSAHWGLVTHIRGNGLGHNWFRQWLVFCAAPSNYPNQRQEQVSLKFEYKGYLPIKSISKCPPFCHHLNMANVHDAFINNLSFFTILFFPIHLPFIFFLSLFSFALWLFNHLFKLCFAFLSLFVSLFLFLYFSRTFETITVNLHDNRANNLHTSTRYKRKLGLKVITSSTRHYRRFLQFVNPTIGKILQFTTSQPESPPTPHQRFHPLTIRDATYSPPEIYFSVHLHTTRPTLQFTCSPLNEHCSSPTHH